jgi:membrane protein
MMRLAVGLALAMPAPVILPGRDVSARAFGRALWRRVLETDLLDYAGSVAFSAILSVFPFLLFVVSLASLFVPPGTVAAVVEDVRRLAPPQAAEVVTNRIHAITSGPSPGIATVGAVLTLWSASGAVASLITAFDRAYEVRDRRPLWKTRGLAVLVTLGSAAFVVAAAAVALVTPAVTAHVGDTLATLLRWLRWPVAALLMAVTVAVLYYFLPDVERPFRLFTPGSVVAVALWILVSLGFSFYAGHFGRYQVVYGALGGAIVLLFWLWISAIVVLLGAEINATLEHLARGPSL